ncbi:MAG: hypothetical protein ABI867_34240 [Kofleriaceae bacterium]
MIRIVVIAVVVVARIATASADPDADADAAHRAALVRERAGDPGAIDAYEALGAARPVTRWTDNAWVDAARLAERTGDFARARRALEQAIAIGSDATLVQRARGDLARLEAATGNGRWDAVARDHDRLASEIYGGGDPGEALAQLEQLVRANPDYPRAASAYLVLGQGWEREARPGRAVELLRAGRPSDPARIGLAIARISIRRGELADAGAELDRLTAAPGFDRASIDNVRGKLAIASRRSWIRRLLWLVLAGAALAAGVLLRREAGSWRAALRTLARPPVEVVFLFPVGAVLAGVGQTGNPVVAKALLAIVIAGLAVAWLSGALLEARRSRGSIGGTRAVIQAVIAAGVVACAAYLAIDRDRLLDLVEETVQHGPIPR